MTCNRTPKIVNDSLETVKAYISSRLIAGDNISIKESVVSGKKVIVIAASAQISSVDWSNITGDINNNEDLTTALDSKLGVDDIIDGGNAITAL